MEKKVILAYSGGLDTSVILKWLINKGYEVICFIADVGQDDDFEAAKQKAFKIGASEVYIEELKKEFIEGYVFRAIKCNARYESRYLLGTSLARPLIAKAHIELAKKMGTNVVSHGATGKGNDQVRFELTFYKLMPNVKIISPWKDEEFLSQFQGRSDMLKYAEEQGIPVEVTMKKPFSMDDNIMHISYEAGILENPGNKPPRDMFKKTVSPMDAPDRETELEIEFEKGVPVKVVNKTANKTVAGSIDLFTYLNQVASENGVGRVDIVENRFVGMKSRGVYETPAGTVLMDAHIDLEAITIDREVARLKDMLMPKVAELIYNGFWFSPEMEFLMAAFEHSQQNVNGKVHLSLYKGNVIIHGRESGNSLYNEAIASMDEFGGYDQQDAKGFIKLNALRLMLKS